MIDSRKTNLSLITREHFTVQSGSIPIGVTSSKAKYPVNSSEISINHNHQVLLVKPISIAQDYTIGLTGDWNRKIRPGNLIQLKRGSIESEYTVKTLKYLPGDNISTISLSHKRNVVNLLDPFVSSIGYNLPAIDTQLKLNRKVESPNNVKSLVRNFTTKLIQESNPLKFSVKAEWSLDPSASAARLRWRSTPRVTSQSNLLFDVVTPGEYRSVPKLNAISDIGRKAEIEMTGYLGDVTILNPGATYSYANISVVGGGGTGAIITANLSGGSIDSLNIINPGQGYTSFPEIIVTGPSGSSGAVIKVETMVFDKVHTIQQGGNYLISPTITIDINPSDIISPVNIIAYTDLQNGGRIDYIRVIDGGSGYVGATVSIAGSSFENAVAEPVIVNGIITDIKVIKPGQGYYYYAPLQITSSTGSGAQAVANVDLYSKWVYVDINYLDKFVILKGFNYDIPYEIEILASQDDQFRGLTKYSNLSYFQISKNFTNQYVEYTPFTLLSKSPGYGEFIPLSDMPYYNFTLIFNHDVFIASTGINATLYSYTDNTNTPIPTIPGGYTEFFNTIQFDLSGYTFTPGDYYISFDSGILNDPTFNFQPEDWYFTVAP
jgi:hypothetical protein